MNNNRQQQNNKPTGDESRDELIDGIKGGIVERYAEFMMMSYEEKREYLKGARKVIGKMKSENAREFCNMILTAMENARPAPTETRSLDLSQMSPESLQTDDCHADEIKGEQLAVVLSGLLNNPNMPEKLCRVIEDELSFLPLDTPDDSDASDILKTPENILFNLENYF